MPTLKWLGIELVEISPREKLISTFGGGLAIFALIVVSCWVLPVPDTAAIVTSMGASAVLLFAVPHGQLSQPWAVVAGQVVSALIGVTCSKLIADRTLAAASAVGLSIGIMQLLKCIHPPGGATAFTAVMGGPAIHDLGYTFAVFPVLANALLITILAILINGPFRWRRYPASLTPRPPVVATSDQPPTHAEIVAAIRSLDSFVDVDEDDLVYLATLLAQPAASRSAAVPGSSPPSNALSREHANAPHRG